MVSATCSSTIAETITLNTTDFTVTATGANTDSCADLKVNIKAECPGKELIAEVEDLWDYAFGNPCDENTTVPVTFDLSSFAAELNGGELPSPAKASLINFCSVEIELEQDGVEEVCEYVPVTTTAYNAAASAAGNTISAAEAKFEADPAKAVGVLSGLAALAGLAAYAVKRRNRAKKSLINDDMLVDKDGQVV